MHRASHPRQPGSGWEALDDVAQGHAQSAQPGLNWDKHDHLATVPQCIHDPSAPYDIRDAWMTEGYAWHDLPARLGKAALVDALGDIAAAREAAKWRSSAPCGTAREGTAPNANICTVCPAQSLDRGPVPAPADAETVAE